MYVGIAVTRNVTQYKLMPEELCQKASYDTLEVFFSGIPINYVAATVDKASKLGNFLLQTVAQCTWQHGRIYSLFYHGSGAYRTLGMFCGSVSNDFGVCNKVLQFNFAFRMRICGF